jgi:hypothetical protein
MTNPDPRALRRSAARSAALVAIPIALAIGALSLWRFGAFDGSAPRPSASPTAQATGPVTTTTRPLTDDVAAVCRTVISHLPDSIVNGNRRPVTAGPEQNAAYGDPALTVACGAPTASFPPTEFVWPFSGVCFVAIPAGGSTVWTTVNRLVPVAVTVPGPSDGSAQSVVPFAPAIAAGDPPGSNAPSGCST